MTEAVLDLKTALRIVDAFRGQQVLIVGDMMLDRYWWGTVSRISPEAPVPVMHKLRSTVSHASVRLKNCWPIRPLRLLSTLPFQKPTPRLAWQL